MAETAIMYDSSKCTACKGCQVACKQWNQLSSPMTNDEYLYTKGFQAPIRLAPKTWLIINFIEEDKKVGIDWNFMRKSCFHCTDAACETACPVGAISHKDNGSVVIDQEKCIGCRYCVASCPFGVPQWNETTNTTFKCWQCQDRTAAERSPACVSTCPTGALQFGDRADMLAVARERVEELKGLGFNKAELYGDKELGGLHTIMVAQRGIEAHGLIRDPKVGTTDFWQLLKPLGGIAAAATVGGLGISYIMARGYKRDAMVLDDATGQLVKAEEVEK
ncbi:MAG: 4Fe-4S dicluster domain-containing protein [Coriobacteriia bacterium]|nr:4Fe-4S dicluster domain-containing protein [Coriobacteriia bacterium]